MAKTIPTRSSYSSTDNSLRLYQLLLFSSLLFFSACTPDQQYQIAAGSIKKSWKKTAYVAKQWPELLSTTEINAATQVIKEGLNTLNAFEGKSLSIKLRKDEADLRNILNEAATNLERLQKDPSFYDFSARLKAKRSRVDDSLDAQLKAIAPLLPLAEAYYHQAKLNLRPTDPTRCSAAVDLHIQGVTFLDQNLEKGILAVDWPDKAKEDFQKNLFQAKLALKDYLAWCRSQAFELRKRSF